jgi:23S rRNA pseudouridine1911/1915/1917 synthase
MRRTFQVGAPSSGTRLDLFLAAACSDVSRSRIQRLIEEGAVKVDGAAAKRSHAVRAGESVTVEVPEPRTPELVAEDIPLSILYEDDQMLAIDKPAGLVVHPAPGHPSGTLVNALLHHVRDLEGVGGELRPGIVHRLDRDTSGVLLVAKTDRAHQMLSRQMRRRSLRKEYLALVAGVPRVRKGEVALAIGRDPRDRKRMKAVRTAAHDAGEELPAGVREARTLYEIERDWFPLGLALLRCRLVTGRTHQIRVHLAASGLPIVGDPVYGRPRYPRVRDAALKARLQSFPRQALHAERIAFHHPVTQQIVEVVAPVPRDLKDLLHAIEETAP